MTAINGSTDSTAKGPSSGNQHDSSRGHEGQFSTDHAFPGHTFNVRAPMYGVVTTGDNNLIGVSISDPLARVHSVNNTITKDTGPGQGSAPGPCTTPAAAEPPDGSSVAEDGDALTEDIVPGSATHSNADVASCESGETDRQGPATIAASPLSRSDRLEKLLRAADREARREARRKEAHTPPSSASDTDQASGCRSSISFEGIYTPGSGETIVPSEADQKRSGITHRNGGTITVSINDP